MFGSRKYEKEQNTAEATMAEAEHNDPTSPEREVQTKSNKKKLRKRKRPHKTEQKRDEDKNDANIDSAQTQTEDEEEEQKEEDTNNFSSGIMSTESFSSLGLSEPTSKAIADMSFHRMTQVTPFCRSSLLFIYLFMFEMATKLSL